MTNQLMDALLNHNLYQYVRNITDFSLLETLLDSLMKIIKDGNSMMQVLIRSITVWKNNWWEDGLIKEKRDFSWTYQNMML